LLRLINVTCTRDVPSARYLIGDAAAYYDWGQRIAGGDWIGHEGFYQTPLYPYVLGVMFATTSTNHGQQRNESEAVVQTNVWKILLLQCAFGAAGVWFIWFAAREWFGPTAGLIAAAMLALYGPAIFYDGIVQKTSLGSWLTCVFLAALALALVRRSTMGWLAAGMTLGLLVLVRENALVWAIVGLAPLRSQIPWKSRLFHAGLFLAGMTLILLPVAVRNRAVAGEWSITTFQAGPNFYIGNHRGASGRYDPLVPGHESPEFERADATSLAQSALGRELSAHEVSNYWANRAWKEIGKNVSGWLRLLGKKVLLEWNRYEIADVESIPAYADSSPVLATTKFWHFGLLCPLAAIGLVFTFHRQEARLLVLIIASMSAAVAAFYVLGRYRFPLVPPLTLLAAAGCAYAPRNLLERKNHTLALAFVLGALALTMNAPIQGHRGFEDERRLDALSFMNEGVALAGNQDLAGAVSYFERGLKSFPQSPECHANLAMALALQGKYEESIPHYQAALATNPVLPGLQFNLGVAFEHLGRREDAIGAFEKSLKENPGDADARNAIERLRK